MPVGASQFRSLTPRRQTLVWWAALVNAELLAVLVYLVLVAPRFGDLPLARIATLYAVPFVWVNVALLAVRLTSVPAATRRRRLVAFALAGGYFLVVGFAGGLYGPAGGTRSGLRLVIGSLPPGWSPALLYGGTVLDVAIVPFKLVGYAALAYLVYGALLLAGRSALGGAVGLFACVSCAVPVIAGTLTGVAGAGTVVALAGRSYLLSTAAFVGATALLAWRPAWRPVRSPWR